MFTSETELTDKTSGGWGMTRDGAMTSKLPRAPVNTPNVNVNEPNSITEEMAGMCVLIHLLKNNFLRPGSILGAIAVLKPGLLSCLHSCLLVHGEPKSHIWYNRDVSCVSMCTAGLLGIPHTSR